jgi:2-hydroxychromene-2-carboxylate isomerase
MLQTSPAFAQCEIKFVPMFLGGIMQATGNKPPVTIKSMYFKAKCLSPEI